MKAKFEVAKAKKIDMGKRASAARVEAARLHSLAEAQEAKVAELKKGMQVAKMAISSVGDQALQRQSK